MKVTRTSQATGITREVELDITDEQIMKYEEGVLIQNAFPNLTPSEREFLMTGITEDEWKDIFGGFDEDNV
jgi:hypothetical protein